MGWAIQIPLDEVGFESRFDWYPEADSFTVDEKTNKLTLLAGNRVVVTESRWSSFFRADQDPNLGTPSA